MTMTASKQVLQGIAGAGPIIDAIEICQRQGHWTNQHDYELESNPYEALDKYSDVLGVDKSLARVVGYRASAVLKESVYTSLKNRLSYFSQHKIGATYITQMAQNLHESFEVSLSMVVDEIKSNPYLLVMGTDGVPVTATDLFEIIDRHEKASIASLNPDRVRAACIAVISQELDHGNSLVELAILPKNGVDFEATRKRELLGAPDMQVGHLIKRVARLTGLSQIEILKLLIEDKTVLFPPVSKSLDKLYLPNHLKLRQVISHGHRLCLRPDWVIGMEYRIRDGLVAAYNRRASVPPAGWMTWLDEFCATTEMVLDEMQRKAVERVWTHSLSIISGRGGTGKTSIMRVLPAAIAKFAPGKAVYGVAPTAKAARRLQNASGIESFTVHSFFGLRGQTTFIEAGKLVQRFPNGGFLVVEEGSMLDFPLFHAIIQGALNTDVQIVFIGDENQLEPVGVGMPFKTILKYANFEITRLLRIYRTEHTGILSMANWVIDDTDRRFLPGSNEDVTFVHATQDDIQGKVLEWFEAHGGIGASDCQIICPFNGAKESIEVDGNTPKNGPLFGVDEINQWIRGDRPYWTLGDKVVQTVNNYNANRLNSMVGIVTGVTNKVITVKFEDNIGDHNINVPEVALELLDAWATTVHRAQGSEWDHVLVVLPSMKDGSRPKFTREMLYTALSRAKKSVTIIGEEPEFILKDTKDQAVKKGIKKDNLERVLSSAFDQKNTAVVVGATAADISF